MGISRRLVVGFVVVLAVALAGCQAPVKAREGSLPSPKVTVKETDLHGVVYGTGDGAISPDGRHIAYVAPAKYKGKFAVYLDGAAGKAYDDIGGWIMPPEYEKFFEKGKGGAKGDEGVDAMPSVRQVAPAQRKYYVLFSPDSRRLAYIAIEGDKEFAVIDGVEGKRYDEVAHSITFSADGKRVAYTARDGKDWIVVVDGAEMKRYPNPSPPPFHPVRKAPRNFVFSPDSKRLAYILSRYGKSLVSVDGMEGKFYGDIDDFAFSPDSRTFIYTAHDNGKEMLVVNGAEENAYESVYSVRFSPDSQRLVYRYGHGGAVIIDTDGTRPNCWGTVVFSRDMKHFACIRNEKYPDCTIDGKSRGEADKVIFSPDGLRFATLREGKIRIDGKTVGDFSDVKGFTFSPDSGHFAFTAAAGWGRRCLVVDGVRGKAYSNLVSLEGTDEDDGMPSFSPDSKHVLAVVRGGKSFVILDGVEGKRYDSVGELMFSADSQHVAYVAKEGGKFLVVMDGVEGKRRYKYMWDFEFTPDSKHLVYMGSADENGYDLMVDETQVGQYSQQVVEAKLLFDGPNKFHRMMAKTQGRFCLLDVEIQEQEK
jgi:Tol biopolymer transport system component